MTISTLTIPTAEPSNMESTSISTISSTVVTDGLYGRYSPGYFHANHSNAAVSVGVVTDVVALSNAGVNLGLGAAKAGVMYGFWWAKMATYLPQAAVKMMQESSYSNDTEETDTLRGNVHLYSIVSSALGAANALVSTAESITLGSLEASHKITTGSLNSTQSLLRMAGAHQGHLYQLAGNTILDKPTAQVCI
ncbi:hypothetical protein SARC_10974 [Sphaeroforma arctica JP610]|uniref:Uncharacterized protein n=1 Tax=Sphaeroforma arctica JP610 TaxID=667725 RepID=A0A0L0FIC7_9EUKA|nr:hypothetical protein SARC_10974 [Sphaeroforma arctica JP610]KNC76529.1 hypothetical protein SARC_10974 [Sphaeroforma arctica JP610]|eukprot:XP_014150431.1 hypothetical protein SARC_10974 [Sphaeroforma arctica JP610]